MINYMKSEWYRIANSKEIYILTGVLSGLTILLNLMLYISNRKIENFRYGTVSFSLSFLVAQLIFILVAGMAVVGILFSGEKRNGILKNAIAYGISREKIFLGKCVTGTVSAICSMIVILTAYIGSAVLLLDRGVVEEPVKMLLEGIIAVLVMAVAAVILAVAFFGYFEKDVLAIGAWFVIIYAIPWICSLAGLKFDLFRRIAEWMPYNYLQMEVIANMSGWKCLWETPEGLGKCLISGTAGVVIFMFTGIVLCRKRDV